MNHVLHSPTKLLRLVALLGAAVLLLAACSSSSSDTGSSSDDTGSSSDDTGSSSDDTAAEAESTDTTAPETTEAETTEAVADGQSADVEFVLNEWTIEGPVTVPAGTVEITATNNGEFGHELAIIRGDSYDALPKIDNGAADEEALGDAVIGRTEVFDGGTSVTATFELEPGTYVFLCNINFGPNSHAAQGQVQTVVVE